MAMITCTECGKSFSDQAACCPNCGCPTEVVLKKASSPQQKAAASREAGEQMRRIVNDARRRADDASDEFDRRSDEIQRRTSHNIDLFGGNVTSQVVGILSDARRACDELYSCYQSLIAEVDAKCRPLLDSSPDGYSIKEVADLIRYLNDESEIESNGSMSLNGDYAGEFASSKYVPSISNRMIQNFWESAYSATPEAKAAAEQRKKVMEESRKKREEAAKKRAAEEAERKKKEDEEKKALQAARAEAQAHADSVSKECEERIARFQKEMDEELARRVEELLTEIKSHAETLKERARALESEISALGLFQGGKKREKRQQLEVLEKKIALLSSANVADKEEERLKGLSESAVLGYRGAIDEYLAARFPYMKSDKIPPKGKNKFSEDGRYAKKPIPEPPAPSSCFESDR